MVKVITYGTYDLLHYGHIKLLERAKALGDYLIVGVTADDFDKTRGKINVQQSLMERIEAVRATGLADKIIVEEYEGQKIDDIRRYGVDIFTVGSDWVGKFDYLNDYCKVVYLPRTEGISSSEIRAEKRKIRLGLVGEDPLLLKHLNESVFVNGVEVTAVYSENAEILKEVDGRIENCKTFEALLGKCDAVYLVSVPQQHEGQIRKAIDAGKHVLVESPIATNPEIVRELFELAKQHQVILMESIKTAYATAYDRLLLLIKSGKIGQVVSIDSVCTSLREKAPTLEERNHVWSGFEAWMPTALLPIYQLLGTNDCTEQFVSSFYDQQQHYDRFTQMNLIYPNAVATARVGMGVKAEGQLVISGTKGYIYVPAPWWKTDYFEVRFENQTDNKRYFYQLEGEGIRYEIAAFIRAINSVVNVSSIEEDVSIKIADAFDKFRKGKNLARIG